MKNQNTLSPQLEGIIQENKDYIIQNNLTPKEYLEYYAEKNDIQINEDLENVNNYTHYDTPFMGDIKEVLLKNELTEWLLMGYYNVDLQKHNTLDKLSSDIQSCWEVDNPNLEAFYVGEKPTLAPKYYIVQYLYYEDLREYFGDYFDEVLHTFEIY